MPGLPVERRPLAHAPDDEVLVDGDAARVARPTDLEQVTVAGQALVAAVEAEDPETRMNDGKVDPSGRFWAGTILDSEGPGGGALYRLHPDMGVTKMLAPLSVANGLDSTDDGRQMLYIDTTAQRVDRIEYDAVTGDWGERRPWVTIPDGSGHPDGMTPDAEVCAWVSLWGGWCAVRFAPDGEPISRIDVPASTTISCVFAGPDLDQLSYVARPGVRGRPPTAFAG